MKFTVHNPLNSEVVSVSEFTMEDMRSISFMVENNSDDLLFQFLESKLSGTANCVTKFIALFKAREQFIADTISLNNGNSNVDIQLSYWFDEFVKGLKDISGVVKIDDFEIKIDYPESLMYNTYDDLLAGMIQNISIKSHYVDFKDITHSEKLELIQNLPYNVIKEVHNYIDQINYNILIFKERLGIPNISVSFFDNSAFNFIKMFFNYYRYDEIMETVFGISSRISDIGFLMSRTPKDINLLIKLYSEEVEKMNNEDKSSNEQYTS
jgi:hypothetical protein